MRAVVLCALLTLGSCSGNTEPSSPPLVVAGQPSGILGARTLITDRPFGIGISSADQVYVTRLDGAVTRGSLPQFVIEGEIAVGSVPRFVVFFPDGSTAFVANEFSSTISRIDVATHVESGLIPLTGSLFRLAISADGNVLYAAGNADAVFVIDALSGALTATIPVDNDPNGMVFSPDGSFLYVSHISGNSVVEIRRGTNTVNRTFDLAMTLSGAQLYVSGGVATGAIYIVDLASETVLSTLVVGGNPRRVAFSTDGNTALFTNENGWVDTID